MEWFEALILGLLQGLTEYLPVSSSGHLAIGSALFGIQGEDNLTFTIAVHVATVLSTLVILWKEISWIFRGLFKFEMNAETKYVINILQNVINSGTGSRLRRAPYNITAVMGGKTGTTNYNDIQEGDVIETFTEIEVEQKL